MTTLRIVRFGITTAALALLVSATAQAATFSMTGKAATGSGIFVDLPAIGNVPCLSITGMFGLPSMAPQTKTVPVSKQFAGPHNAAGCIPGGPKAVNVNGTGGFTI